MWRLRKKNKQTTYCGKTKDEMRCLIEKLCELQDDVILTGEENEAVKIAIQAMTDIQEGMAK